MKIIKIKTNALVRSLAPAVVILGICVAADAQSRIGIGVSVHVPIRASGADKGNIGTILPLIAIGVLIAAGVWATVSFSRWVIEAAKRSWWTSRPVQRRREVAVRAAQSVTSIDAKIITKGYPGGSIQADGYHAGEVVEITGEVDRITIDSVPGMGAIILKGVDGGGVVCDFNDAGELNGLCPGRTVKVKGRCNYKFNLPRKGNGMHVGISDCVL